MLASSALVALAFGSFAPNFYAHGLQTSGDLPSCALTYAPVIHLSSREGYWPSDPAVHLQHVIAKKNDGSIDKAAPNPLTLANLNYRGSNENTWLTSKDDITVEPKAEWLRSTYGKPGKGRKSAAPATIIVIDKSDIIKPGYVDVYYSLFYNWEAILIRFLNGKPQSIHYSQHEDGTAYTYAATDKVGSRPLVFVSRGGHANFPTSGPRDSLFDRTDKGPAWDITCNYVAYWYSKSKGFVPVTGNKVPTGWLEYIGRWPWGNKESKADPLVYANGIPGPIGHNLARKTMCQFSDCPIKKSIK
ncbi:putative effector protein [Ceratobasidium theobromae]|uniref:Putative effector protein n=1 Tax=Ceratobasidium theobromae TaxID=1582974 RepID=A0A5N5QKX5_9AGAM|nr:putative effector protein [Ceratobasidium theobromae]